MKSLPATCALLTALIFAPCVFARDLDVANAHKTEIRHGQIGPRPTLIFYIFADQDAVLQLGIRQEGGSFTLTGKMQLFQQGTGAEEIGKWINNQHSCGLYPDVPKPVTVELPAAACRVVESKRKQGQAPNSPMGDQFEDYALTIQVSDLKREEFRLKGFTADTGAFVKVGPRD